MTPSGFERRRNRTGSGSLPPNPKQWTNEHNGLDLREEIGAGVDTWLDCDDAFALVPQVQVVPHGEIPAAAMYIEHFRGVGAKTWSGLSLRIADDLELVLYNDAHPATRVRATLMEEFFHLRLGHPRSTVRILAGADGWRTHDDGVEAQAYGSAAAALLPYAPLKEMIQTGASVSMIAGHYKVSPALVNFRMKVTRIYRRAARSRR